MGHSLKTSARWPVKSKFTPCETNLDGHVIEITSVLEVAGRVDTVGQTVKCLYVRITRTVTSTHRHLRIVTEYLQMTD